MINEKTEFVDLPNEVWRDIQWAQGKLQISNAGRMRYISKRGKVLEVPKLCNLIEWEEKKMYSIYNPKKKKADFYKGEYVRDDHFTKDEFIELAEELRDKTNNDL